MDKENNNNNQTKGPLEQKGDRQGKGDISTWPEIPGVHSHDQTESISKGLYD